MSKVSKLRNEIRSKIEVIKKVNDNPKLLNDNLYDIYQDGVTKTEKLLQQKIDGLSSKLKRKNDNKSDIFGSLLETASGFLSNKTNTLDVNDKLLSGNKIKKYALDSAKVTVEDVKTIITDSVKEVLFVDENTSICGVETTMPSDTMTISPTEFDFLQVLQVDPTSKVGKIMYEDPSSSTGKVKMNTDLYDTFSTNYTFSSKSGASLFDLSWDSNNQQYNVSGLQQSGTPPKISKFISDYYGSIETPNLNYITKTAMLMTLQGDSENLPVFDNAINQLNQLCNKLFKICGSPLDESDLIQTTSKQFSENDQDITSYFDFNDVEGIDVDDEDSRFRKVMKFVDCGNFEVPVSQTNYEDFVYLSEGTTNLNKLVDDTLEKAARNASLSSDNFAPFDNIQLELINAFILNVPKALVSSIISPKIMLPIVMSWKQIKGFTGDVKDYLKKLSKLFYTIIKKVFWKFIKEFWKKIKKDLLNYVLELAQKIAKKKYQRYVLILTSIISIIKKVLATGLDNCQDLFNTMLNVINGALSGLGPTINVPGVILGFSDLLPGYSTDRAFMNATERMSSLGLNTGPIYGEANEMLTMIKSVIEGQSHEEDANSFIKVSNKKITIPTPVGPIVIPPGILNSAGKKI